MKALSLKSIRELIKIFVVSGDLFMSIHCIAALCGLHLCVFEFIFGQSLCAFIVLILSTYLLGFCNNFRWLIFHSFIIQCFIMYNRMFGLGVMLTLVRIILPVSGLALLSNIIIKDPWQKLYENLSHASCGKQPTGSTMDHVK